MVHPPSSMRDIARRLLAVEAANQIGAQRREDDAVRVCEKLRAPLTRFAGADGFAALLRRALALAREEVPALQGIQVNPDGSCAGVQQLAAAAKQLVSDGDAGAEAGIAIMAHLLGLLVTFIGEPLTLRMVGEAWPDASLDEMKTED